MRPSDTIPAPATCNGRPQLSKSGSDRREWSAHPNALLLIDPDGEHAHQIIQSLTARGLGVDFCINVRQAANRLKQIDGEYDLVIVNISDVSRPWLRLLRFLRESSIQSGVAVGPFLLCVSTAKYDALFELQIERMGGRLVYER
jgi:hypothetical protein